LQEYEKKGYLIDAFKIFRLKDIPPHKIPFHYHSFDKIILFLNGKVDYIIEGKSYALIPRDIVFVSHNDIHRPVIDALSSIYHLFSCKSIRIIPIIFHTALILPKSSQVSCI